MNILIRACTESRSDRCTSRESGNLSNTENAGCRLITMSFYHFRQPKNMALLYKAKTKLTGVLFNALCQKPK